MITGIRFWLALLMLLAGTARAQSLIDYTAPDADTLPAAAVKINANFTELYGLYDVLAGATTVGHVLRVTGAGTYGWGALDLADSDAITGDLPDANLSANVGLLNATQSWSGSNAWTGSVDISTAATHVGLGVNGGAPEFALVNASAAANSRIWDAYVNSSGTFVLEACNDANSTCVNALSITRSGPTLTNIAFGANSGVTFASANLSSVGQITATRFVPTTSSVPSNGMYLPAANTIGIGTNTTGTVWVDTALGVKKGGVTISAAERAVAGGVTYTNTTQTGNAAATETDAFSHTLTAATLNTNGESLEFEAAGTFAATASTDKRVKVVFGSTTIFDTGALAAVSAASWHVKGTIIRTGAATQKVIVSFDSSYASLNSTSTYTAATETLANALTLKLTVNGTNANDTVAQFYKEKWFPFL